MPSVLAVLRLMNSSTFVDCCTGSSARTFAFENTAGVDADQTVSVRETASIAHQAAGRGELAVRGDRGHRMADRQCGELFDPA